MENLTTDQLIAIMNLIIAGVSVAGSLILGFLVFRIHRERLRLEKEKAARESDQE